MSGKTGFDILKLIKSETYQPRIIFTTGFEKYAMQAIKHAACDYLLKPIYNSELVGALTRISQLRLEY